MKTKIVPIEQAIADEKIYPRNMVDWVTVARYADAMKAGADFPPIVVADFGGRLIVVDGFHRLQANKNNKASHITVELLEDLDEKQIYIESVKRNIGHGRQFNSQERVKIMLTLQEWNMSLETISEIVRIPTDSIQPFIAKRITRITETQEIIPLKAPLRHLAGKEISGEIPQEHFANRDQLQIIDSFISLIENDWLNLESEIIRERVEKIYNLLKDKI